VSQIIKPAILPIPTQDITDEEILVLLDKSSTYERGFKLLMSKYQERLYKHIRRMVWGHDDTNDVIQNTFIKVFKGIQNYQQQSKLYTWLYRIATNEAITFLNKKQRKSAISLDDGENHIANQLKTDAYFDGDEIQIKLLKAIDTLPEKQRIVFNLRYFEEMSYNDMSSVLETSVGALKASYHHAVKKVEGYLVGSGNA